MLIKKERRQKIKKLIPAILISIICATLAYLLYVIFFRSRLVIRANDRMPSVIVAAINTAGILPIEIPMHKLISGSVARITAQPKPDLITKIRSWFSVSVDPLS